VGTKYFSDFGQEEFLYSIFNVLEAVRDGTELGSIFLKDAQHLLLSFLLPVSSSLTKYPSICYFATPPPLKNRCYLDLLQGREIPRREILHVKVMLVIGPKSILPHALGGVD
jgi:hypothetical protein